MYFVRGADSFHGFPGFIPAEQSITRSVQWAIRSVITDDGEPDKRNTCEPWSWLEVHPFITVLERNRWPDQALLLANGYGVPSNLDDKPGKRRPNRPGAISCLVARGDRPRAPSRRLYRNRFRGTRGV